ncbi:hypothetical protein HanXRQr2_Chr16g0763101 [Helianthus annuus]|uniref:Uncharacterized protein n=2 Tax=Helianthus annuus TaxID=4232 RepID=A0A9K3DW20_HELAN|nr:hypothetical protein HanXRQr2_Chr16g0763101 [Helianthus annuus]KAJ0822368.1 hypothetical protein HanPSC8_Chr16g0731151 [Helianthus annuus]
MLWRPSELNTGCIFTWTSKDIDETLCDSDPLHRTHYAFCDMLQEIGFNGKHNEELWSALLSDWELEKAMKFIVDQEALFRRILFWN